MKILIIARGVPNKHDPQEGCFEWDQAKALASNGHEVVIMAVDGRVRKFWRPIGISKTEKDNITAYKIFYFPTAIIRRLLNLKLGYNIEAYLAKKLFKHILWKHGSFDLIHSHYLTSTFFGAKIKDRFGCKLVATEHWSEVNKPVLSKEIRYLGDYAYKRADKVIAVSDFLGKSLLKHFNVGYSVIHNLLDTSHLRKVDNTPHKNFTIICVGSLLRIKGYDIMVQAFAKSKLKDNPNVTVKIFGGGPEYDNILSLVKSLNLENKVKLFGKRPKSEIYQELHNADLYVLSSRRENFPVALIEANANGLPAVITLCGGTVEYPLSSVTKVPAEDVEAMASAIDQCYENRENINRVAIQEETLENFSPNVIVDKLENIYKEAIYNN